MKNDLLMRLDREIDKIVDQINSTSNFNEKCLLSYPLAKLRGDYIIIQNKLLEEKV